MNSIRSLFFSGLFAGLCWPALLAAQQEQPAVFPGNPLSVSARFDIGSCYGQEFGAFYPVGWSQKGAFAWIARLPQEDTENVHFDCVIQDAVSNQILWHSSVKIATGILQTAAVADTLGQRFRRELSKHGIAEKAGEIRVRRFPLMLEKDTLEAEMIKTSGDSERGDILLNARLILRSARKGEKEITRFQSDAENPALQDLALCAALVSPFEERMALIVCRRYLGFNEICKVRFSVLGTHMKDGW